MDPDSEVQSEHPPFLRIYKSGRVERMIPTIFVPPSVDPATGVSCKDVTIDPATGVSARLYLPTPGDNPNPSKKFPVLIYYHGGGFCILSAFFPTYHNFLAPFSSKSQTLIVSVEYRLAPETKMLDIYKDAWSAFQWAVSGVDEWIADHGDLSKVFVAGDSSGGNLSHHVASLFGAGGSKMEGMMLIHPYFGGTTRWESESVKEISEAFWRMLGLMDEECRPMDNPMGVEGGKGMRDVGCRRVIVCVAEKDFLKWRGLEYYEKLKGSGWEGEVEVVEDEGEEHCFHLHKPGSVKESQLIEKLVAFINKVL